MISMKKSHPLISVVSNALVDLPSPASISYFWNFGSLLGLTLASQILTGVLLAMSFSANSLISFDSVCAISESSFYGWVIRMMHANGASMFFFFLYLHVSRGIYFSSFFFSETWNIGVVILLLTMATAFLGYVLPWGQMSFWGASVITGLIGVVPFVGPEIIVWLWGGFSVDNATLTRFFSLHFLMPFVILAMVMVHLVFLHESGSGNPLGLPLNSDKVLFHPYFSTKDLLGAIVAVAGLLMIVFFTPWSLGDPENFINANPMVTPIHIQPEWYFLFAYAILRSIPNKLGGVLALAGSIMALFVMPAQAGVKFRGMPLYFTSKALFWPWCVVVLLLTWVGACPVEEPYVLLGQILSLLYFSFFFLNWAAQKSVDSITV